MSDNNFGTSMAGAYVGARLAQKGPSRSEQIKEEIVMRDYAELTKRELAETVASWAWDKGYSEKEEERFLGKGFIIIALTVTAFAFGLGFSA